MTRQLFSYDPTIGYRFVPGLQARVDHEGGGYLLRTNQAGFRCRHEVVREKPPGTYRILLFGDSFTAGDAVSDKYRYGDLLEGLLPGCQVLNFGLSGSGTDQQYLIWREHAASLEHDLVLIGVQVENIRRVVARYRLYQWAEGEEVLLAKPYFTLEPDASLRLHQVPVPREPLARGALAARDAATIDRGGRFAWLRESVNRLGPRAKDLVQRVTRYQPLPGYDRPDHPDWRLLAAILRRWLTELTVPAVLCPIPLYQYVEDTASPAAYQARFRSLADPPRVIIHDPLPDFRARPRAERRRFRFEHDVHPTPAAHRVLAESLANGLRPLLARGRG